MSVLSVLGEFAQSCNRNERLRTMNRDWTRTVAILSDDTGTRHWLASEAGEITVGEGDPPRSPDLEVRAPENILRAIFSGEMTPTEPYNAGDLLVRGSQDDLMRLDIITLLVWGA